MAQVPLPLAKLRAADLALPDVSFTDGENLYVTSGQKLGHGGMGNVWTVTRRPIDGEAPPLTGVDKTYREVFLSLLREDEQARRRFDHFERVIDGLRGLSHPNVLPVEMMVPISDNYLLITPLAGPSLLQLMPQQPLSPRERVQLFVNALRGLKELHQRGIVHRDFTLNNVLASNAVAGPATGAVVFDFDLSVVPELLPPEDRNYGNYYQGRVLGSPEFSIAPELLDDVLGLEPLSPRIDVYAAGTALFALFSELSVYGDAPDLSALFYCIAEGVVRSGESRVPYPEAVPVPLRPIIDTCLEREPAARFADAGALLNAVEHALAELTPPAETEELRTTFRRSGGLDYVYTRITLTDEERFVQRAHPQVSREELDRMEAVLGQHGYLVEKALGRVKGHPIFLAMPDPELVAAGRFPEDNPYRKIVTAIDLTVRDPEFLASWLGRIHPILMRVRQGYLTALYKVVHEKDLLLLFSEYVADAHFGTELGQHELTLEEVLGLGLIVGRTIERLHAEGLAHNNVRPESLVFKGHRDAGRVQSLFVGLVEPSFAAEALIEDVRNLAGMLAPLMRQSRIDALRPTVRPLIDRLRERLRKMAAGEARTVTIKALLDMISDGLGAIEPNFDLVRAHNGNTIAYADLLVRHSLYNRLYAGGRRGGGLMPIAEASIEIAAPIERVWSVMVDVARYGEWNPFLHRIDAREPPRAGSELILHVKWSSGGGATSRERITRLEAPAGGRALLEYEFLGVLHTIGAVRGLARAGAATICRRHDLSHARGVRRLAVVGAAAGQSPGRLRGARAGAQGARGVAGFRCVSPSSARSQK